VTPDQPDDRDLVAEAVAWLAATPHAERRPVVPVLMRRFSLSTKAAIEAIRAHSQRLARA
jgi:hypothetical protein